MQVVTWCGFPVGVMQICDRIPHILVEKFESERRRLQLQVWLPCWSDANL
jgi:hypothetical protein